MRVAAAAVVAMLVTGCEDLDSVAPESDPREVVFEFDAPDFAYATVNGEMPATRTIPSLTAFPDGAIIHVIGTFTLDSGRNTYAYGVYAFNKKTYRWVPQVQPLLWPEHAEKAKFEAFYLPGGDGTGRVARIDITGNNGSSEIFALSPPYDDNEKKIIHTDPLKATKENVKYGAAVQMRFNHVCSRLILTDVGDMETDECWLEYAPGDMDQLNNGYRFTINVTPETGEYQGKIEFVPYEGMKGEKYRYARAQREEDYLTLGGETTGSTKVNALCFYLAPGKYKGCKVFYRDEKPFLTLDVDELDESKTTEGVTQEGLQSGYSYTLDIRTAQGVVNNEWVDPEEEWQGEDRVVRPLNLVEFMEALRDGTSYTGEVEGGETLELLTNVGGKDVRINYDIDFQNKNMYELFKNDGKNFGMQGGTEGCWLGTGMTVYGNHKRFINMASPLFDRIEGNVFDLQIKKADIWIPEEFMLYDEESAHSCRNAGALTSFLKGGIVENVLLDSVKVSVKIPNMKKPHGDDGHTHDSAQPSVGALIGEAESSTVQNIRIHGYIKVDVQQEDYVNPAMTSRNYAHVGGLIGQQKGGSTSEISAMGDNPEIDVTVNLKSESGGQIEVGGIVGYTESNVSDISLMTCETKVSAKESQCGEIFVGGIVGYANFSEGTSRQMMRDAYVRGNVTGGTAITSETSISNQYSIGHTATGGIAGYLSAFSVVNCRFNGSVIAGNRLDGQPNCVLVSTGGGIGRIKDAAAGKADVNSVCHVFECTVRATVQKPTGDDNAKNLTGAFIGQQNFEADEYKLSPYYGNDGPYYACPPTDNASALRYSDVPTDNNSTTVEIAANPSYGNKNSTINEGLNFCGALYEDEATNMIVN